MVELLQSQATTEYPSSPSLPLARPTHACLSRATSLSTLVFILKKVDRESARLSGELDNEIFDLFVQLGADDDQMEYPTLYASGKQG